MTISKEKIERIIRPEVRGLSAYHVPAPGDFIKLDAMENPYDWPDWLVEEWLDGLRQVRLNRYPDASASALKAQMRAAMGIPDQAAVILGNGSDELIQMIIQAVAGPGKVIMAPEPSFVMYRQIATVTGLDYAAVPLQADYSLAKDVVIEALDEHRPAVVFLAYPNNPSGNLFDAEVIRAILARAPGLVVVDEAYAPFSDETFMTELQACDNLLVLRTLSKMGFAGLRLGLLAGDPAWLSEIEKTRLPYNISSLNQLTGEFALAHREVFEAQAATIRQDRTALLAGLQALPALTVYPSAANFILFRVPAGQAAAVHAGLKQQGVLIKNLDGSSPALDDCLRVTVGQPQENAAFLSALATLL